MFGHRAREFNFENCCKKAILDHFSALFCIFCHQGIYLWWFQSPKMSFHAKRQKWYFWPQMTPGSESATYARKFKSNEMVRKTNTKDTREGDLSPKVQENIHPWLPSLAYLNRINQSSTSCPQTFPWPRTAEKHSRSINLLSFVSMPVFNWSAAPWKISQERLANVQGIIDIYSSDLLQIKMRK